MDYVFPCLATELAFIVGTSDAKAFLVIAAKSASNDNIFYINDEMLHESFDPHYRMGLLHVLHFGLS